MTLLHESLLEGLCVYSAYNAGETHTITKGGLERQLDPLKEVWILVSNRVLHSTNTLRPL